MAFDELILLRDLRGGKAAVDEKERLMRSRSLCYAAGRLLFPLRRDVTKLVTAPIVS
jgi:hypothetical protein